MWLIRHVAQCLLARRPLPGQARSALTARRLDVEECLALLGRLAGLLPMPLAIGPPCSTLCSNHERQIGRAVRALEAGDSAAVEIALQRLAAPVGLTRQETRRAGVLLARLAGCGDAVDCPCTPDHAAGATTRSGAPAGTTGLPSLADQGFSP